MVGGSGRWALVLAVLPALFGGCSDGKAASNGSAGGAGSPASAGSAGDAGTCRATRAQTPTSAAPATFDADTVARAATVIGSCIPDDGVARHADYLWSGQASSDRDYWRLTLQLQCLADSACGCAATANCLGYSVGSEANCTQGCSGDVFSSCVSLSEQQPDYRLTLDCESLSLRCDPAASCIEGAPTACDASFVAGCNSAGQPEYCDGGLVRHGPTCTDLGLQCAAGACTGTGAACSTLERGDQGEVRFSGMACDGTTLTACVGGKQTNVDCRQRGPAFGCQHVGEEFFCGLASDCVPGNSSMTPSTASTCNGTTLEFCNAGRLDHVDCLALGFTGCTVDPDHGSYGCTPGSFSP